jgi:ABC-type sugar transport system permease subunit
MTWRKTSTGWAPENGSVVDEEQRCSGRAERAGLGDSGVNGLLAAVAGLIAFVAVPFGTAIVLSLYNVQANQVRPPTFVGLDQYVRRGGLIVNSMAGYAFARLKWVGRDIEEAARMDGLGAWGTFVRLVAPNSKPVFATVAILTFMSSWGQFLWPLLVTSDPAVRPLPLQMGVFSAQLPPNWGHIFAFGTLLVLPVWIIFLIFQRYFVQSVAGSAVKG